MSANSKIEWCHHTFNPWWGCVKVSQECALCYAEALAKRYGHAVWGPASERRFFGDAHWRESLKWNRDAEQAGERRRVFCASMADVFEDRADLAPHRARLWALIEATPHLDWLLLTKRPENMTTMAPAGWHRRWPANVWAGTTVGHPDSRPRIAHLLRVPAAVRFLSVEPLLAAIEFSDVGGRSDAIEQLGRRALAGIDWVIVGGESGPGARPMHPEWARSIRDQCVAAGVPFFFKQWGGFGSRQIHLNGGPAPHRMFSTFEEWVAKATTWVNGGTCLDMKGRVLKIGADFQRARDEGAFPVAICHPMHKKAAGRLLDGRTWDELPASGSSPSDERRQNRKTRK